VELFGCSCYWLWEWLFSVTYKKLGGVSNNFLGSGEKNEKLGVINEKLGVINEKLGVISDEL
jgi:hypothetical protein